MLVLQLIKTNYGKLIAIETLAISSSEAVLKQYAANYGLGYNSNNLNWVDDKATIDLDTKFLYPLVDHFSILNVQVLEQ